ncbi:MAG: acetoacetate--CoA ligase [Acidimicrobiia bacterium]|nr:acetoacetate--CoA ligase [Acidimicrobiia bacterium]
MSGEPPAPVSALDRFARARGVTTYPELHEWSVHDLDGFWSEAARFLGVTWHDRPVRAVGERSMPCRTWFAGGTLSYAEHLLARAREAPDEIAVVERNQTRAGAEWTWSELARAVHACAAGLRRLGVKERSHVAAYAPNIVETLVGFLATASLGAVWSTCPPELGTTAAVDRLGQVRPSVLFHADGYRYGDRLVDRRSQVEAIVRAVPSIEHAVAIRYAGSGRDDWGALLGNDATPATVPVPFDHPLCVLYSSGTTGPPKPIVHGHGGITLEHLKALVLHHDLGPGERFFWFTTTGWMMWNYLVSGLATGASIVLFDGDPTWPDPSTLWDVAAETGTTVFGGSAPFIMACRKRGVVPPRGRLRQVGSTGAPLPADGFRRVREALGDEVRVHSISGGTDVCTAFLGMNPMQPVVDGEITGPLLGCAAAVFDDDGRPVGRDVEGELVITEPMPSMPLGFVGDRDGARYRASYFERFPGVWHHGDRVTVTRTGGWVVSGRSDATLNRGGVRLGTAELYRVVEAFDEVIDSLVVHVDGDDDRVVLFVQLAPGVTLDEELRSRITGRLRTELSPRHVPDVVEQVPAVPRTLSGKKLEVPVKRLLGGDDREQVFSGQAPADPVAMEWFAERADRWRSRPERPPSDPDAAPV